MKGDFTRWTFKPENHYHSVLKQQGRVDLDADWNEQDAITSHRVEIEAMDVIGLSGAPAGNVGFSLTAVSGGSNLSIGAGRAYVDGILCENEQPVLITAQPDLPGFTLQPVAGSYIAYLEVWLRHITALDDDSIREVALGGPDTCTRAKTVWQVGLLPVKQATIGCSTAAPEWTNLIAAGTATLAAQAQPDTTQADPCLVPAKAGFRRLENQLYRVEIHDFTAGKATFKWSRDNGSVATAWLPPQSGQPANSLRVSSAGPDSVLGFAAGQWVELSDDVRELNFQPGTLVQLISVSGNILTYDPDPTHAIPPGPITYPTSPDPKTYPDIHPRVRRWDSAPVLPVQPNQWTDLEDGVQVNFSNGTFLPGDYWLIPARTLTADVEWPSDGSGNPAQLPPKGIRRHFCRLAIVQSDGKTWTVTDPPCLPTFPSLTTVLTVERDGKLVGTRNTLNFTGAGITAVTDNPAERRIDIQIAGGGGAGESSPTRLLFPYCKVVGNPRTPSPSAMVDTFIAVANTTANPFGPEQPAGPVTLYCFGTGLPSSPLKIPLPSQPPPPILAPGQMAVFHLLEKLVSAGFPGGGTFEGYVIADCGFAGAYGFGQILTNNAGPQQNLVLTDSYLAIPVARAVQPVALNVLSLTPPTASVGVGGQTVFTVTLSDFAPANTDVQISFSPAGMVNVPSSVTVPANSATTPFTATALKTGTVTITATLSGQSKTATLTIVPPSLSEVKIPTQMVLATDGTPTTASGQVVLNGPAPTGGAKVTLATSSANILAVDPSTTIPAGSTSGAFTITANSAGNAVISGTFPAGTTVSSNRLTVKPPIVPPGGGTPKV